MAWNSSSTNLGGLTGYEIDWIYNISPSPGRMQLRSNRDPNTIYRLSYIDNSYNWKSKKSYQFSIDMVNYYAISSSFSITTNWNDSFNYFNGSTGSGNPGSVTQSFYFYSSPTSDTNSTTYLNTFNNGTFSDTGAANEGITGFKVNELDFKIQGFSYYKLSGTELQVYDKNSIGWYYNKVQDVYFWYDRSDLGTMSGLDPIGGPNGLKKQDVGYRMNNYLIKFIPYSYFNLTFDYQNSSNFPLYIYLAQSKPSEYPATSADILYGTFSQPLTSTLLATLTQSSYTSVNFYGLNGNQYIYFVGGYSGLTSSLTYSSIYIQNLNVEGGYHSGNNRRYVMSSGYTPIGLSGATYSASVGTGNTVNSTQSLSVDKIYSKIGNGIFMSGIWENGVWNSGWRYDEGMYEFTDVYRFFGYNKSKRWRCQILGHTQSVSNFDIGDNVSIGNIIAIDINEDRILLKNYFTIISKTEDTIIVEFDNEFPLRRIERDSNYHRIYVTKNVWLSGGFMNGYFRGIWNYGLFKGYPLITEMFDSHWIDGIFDGGHFSSSLYSVPDFASCFINNTKLGLTFNTKHGLSVNDVITIDKNDKGINLSYDGDKTIISVIDEYNIVVDEPYGLDSTNESGSVTINLSSGVVQKIEFKSNNRSKITSIQSSESDAVFIYDSWMDVNYYSDSAVTIGKPQTQRNILSNRIFSENNLYGYPTEDILESVSSFRDSFSTSIRKYKLGTKYRIFSDFIGDAGKFEKYFGTASVSDQNVLFDQGWTYSRHAENSIQFTRTSDTGVYPIVGEEMVVTALGSGGILDISNDNLDTNILNRTYQTIEKNRYTKIEFDMITFSHILSETNTDSKGKSSHNPLMYLDKSAGKAKSFVNPIYHPLIHFNNLNFVTRNVISTGTGSTPMSYSLNYPSTFLPIYQNINHLQTKKQRKVEYFYNKRNLEMTFYGYNGLDGELVDTDNDINTAPVLVNANRFVDYTIDNLHFYEVDMIPFFQYFTEDNINKGIQIPYQGISPFIDYSNTNFNFINSISIGLDSIHTENSNIAVSGVGIGIGTTTTTSGGSIYIASSGGGSS